MSVGMSLFGGQKGGLTGLISQFNSKGLGDVIGFRVSTGKNLSVSVDQLQCVLGKDTINNFAPKFGMDILGGLLGKK